MPTNNETEPSGELITRASSSMGRLVSYIIDVKQIIPDENQPLLAENSTIQVSNERDGRGNTSSLGAIFIIINAALGAGLLAFPVAFYSAGGYIPAMLTMMVSVCYYM